MKRDDGSVILKNPATVHVSRMLENLLLFMKYVSIFHVTLLDLSNQLPFPLFLDSLSCKDKILCFESYRYIYTRKSYKFFCEFCWSKCRYFELKLLYLKTMFFFHRSMNGSWHPAMLQRRHPELEKSFDLVENEKYAILGKQCQDLWTF